jgi:transposase-like protein
MTATQKGKPSVVSIEALLGQDRDRFKQLLRESIQDVLEAEMTQVLGAGTAERSPNRSGYRAGYYTRSLITRIGKLELRVPRDREGRLSTELLERYQRSEKTLVSALAEMYVQGVSTRKVKAITEELCGHAFSASTISQINKGLDEALERFASRTLEEPYPYLVLDARYEKVRIDGVIRPQAVLIAIGINWEGRRQVLEVELTNRESAGRWKEFLRRLKDRGLHGVEFVVCDDHDGLRKAVAELLTDAAWQRCYVHFLRNALDHLPRKANDDCLQELRWIYERRDLKEAQTSLAAWLKRLERRYPKLTDWAEEHIGQTLTFYWLPRQHHKHVKSTNLLERVNEEIKRRTRVVRIFPNEQSCLRLVRALCAEIHETWLEDNRHINMDLLREQKKAAIKLAA